MTQPPRVAAHAETERRGAAEAVAELGRRVSQSPEAGEAEGTGLGRYLRGSTVHAVPPVTGAET
ncbi:MAG: hypothetical protein ACREM3_17370 [Candidatus Rokuibacteriota bacterium]